MAYDGPYGAASAALHDVDCASITTVENYEYDRMEIPCSALRVSYSGLYGLPHSLEWAYASDLLAPAAKTAWVEALSRAANLQKK